MAPNAASTKPQSYLGVLISMGIRVDKVSKSYEGRVVLKDISFEVKDGEFVTFLAPTGEGKTSLLRMIAGVDRPDSGRIFYNDQDVTKTSVQDRSIAMVYQWFVNYPSMSVYENIASPLRVSKTKIAESEIDRRVKETAELLKIEGILTHYPSEISGGQQQRLAIARALIKDADYMFLDEPLTNLDYKLREELRVELKRIFSLRGRGAVVYATPDPTDALALSSYVGFLHKGRLLQFGRVDEVYHNPVHKEVGSYFSHPAMNIFECDVVSESGKLWLKASDEIMAPVDNFREVLKKDRYLLGIRPHSISTNKESDDMIPFTARVELGEVVGSDTELHINHNGIPLIALQQGMGRYEIGARIVAYLDTRRFFIFDKESGALVAKTHRD